MMNTKQILRGAAALTAACIAALAGCGSAPPPPVAVKVSGDAVINIVTDLETEISATGEPLKTAFTGSKPGLEANKRVIITEKYTATALAIKYGDTISTSGSGTASFGGPGGQDGAGNTAAMPENR
jgi:hypothetical protein